MKLSPYIATMLALAIVASLSSMMVGKTLAQTEPTEIFQGQAGPYQIVVRTLPAEPIVGIVHFSIVTTASETSEPITDALISVIVTHQSGDPKIQARALNTPQFANSYESNIKFIAPGVWEIRIEIDSARLGQSSTSFPLNVGDVPPASGGASTAYLFLGLLVFLLGGTGYLIYSSRRKLKAKSV